MTIGELWRRIVHLVKGTGADDELREEMALHVALRAEANRRAGAGGADAEFAARKQFGNQTMIRAEARDPWGFAWAEEIGRNFRYAVRRLVQRPGFSIAVIGVLALGIGATTAMFSAVDAAILRPLPFANPSQLVVLHDVMVPFDPGPGRPSRPVTGPASFDVREIGKMPELFSHVAVYAAGGLNLADPDHPLRVKAGVVSTDFFGTLGVLPVRGRTFIQSEGVGDGAKVAVLSYGIWQRQYGGSEMVGKNIELNGNPYEVVGVMPRGFGFPDESDLWIPMAIPNTFATFSAFRGFLPTATIARVASGLRTERAAKQLLARWEQRYALDKNPDRERNELRASVEDVRAKGTLSPLQQELTRNSRPALLILLGATLLLLLVACANVTNLLLSQAAARRHEIAVRAVLGASRGRIVRQLLTESIVLAASGTLLGIALAPIALWSMSALMPVHLSGLSAATVDLRVLGFAATLALITGIGFGVWPALGTTGDAPAETIKSGGRGATAGGAGRARRILVGAELALTVVLLVGSVLMLRSFERLMSMDRGIQTENIGTLEMSFAASSGTRAVRLQKISDVLARLDATPGVIASGAINDLPLGAGGGIAVGVEGDNGPPVGGDNLYARLLEVTPGYFKAMGMSLKRGRVFAVSDDSLAPQVAVISEAMAKAYWHGLNAMGRTFNMGGPPITVIGIVGDVRERKLEDVPQPQMYLPVTTHTPSTAAFVVRGTIPAVELLSKMTAAVRAVDPAQATYNVRTMDQVLSKSVAPRRTNTVMITAFGVLALLLSALGIYAVVAYSVAQRTRELGIRSALGATGSSLISLVAGEMAWVTAIGILAGLGGAWALAKVLASLVYGVDVHDPLSFAIVPVAIAVPALIAALIPAWRATRVNPADVMRAD